MNLQDRISRAANTPSHQELVKEHKARRAQRQIRIEKSSQRTTIGKSASIKPKSVKSSKESLAEFLAKTTALKNGTVSISTRSGPSDADEQLWIRLWHMQLKREPRWKQLSDRIAAVAGEL